MTDRAEIERLLNQTGRTLEGLPDTYDPEFVARSLKGGRCGWTIGGLICHQSDVIELLVGALRDALDKPMQKPLTHEKAARILEMGDPVFCEERNELLGKDHWIKPFGVNDGYLDKLLYGEAWRCWASRPTDEEREAAAWEN